MGKPFKLLFSILLLGLATAVTVAANKSTPTEPIRDPNLEKRLTSVGTFLVRPKDTLKTLARFLYGHESWWIKLRQENKSLRSFEPDQVVPEGTLVSFKSAKIGSSYKVQPNDWLIRIVLWKYGNSERWNEIYKRNNHGMKFAEMIHPGDVLTFEDDGTVRLEETGEVLVAGLKMEQSGAAESSVNPVDRSVAQVKSSPVQKDPSKLSFQIGVAIGVLFFFLVSFILWSLRVGIQNIEEPTKAKNKKKKADAKIKGNSRKASNKKELRAS